MSRSKQAPYDPKYPTARDRAPDTEAIRRRLEADLEAFRAGGGEIEVLRITRPRDRRDDEADAAPDDKPKD
jgi:hypothetical protein